MSYNTPIAAGQIKKGQHAILKDRPCKVLNVTVSKTGKHGHAKAHFLGEDVFTGKKYEDNQPTTHTMYQPILTQTAYPLMDIDEDEFLCLMREDGSQREDLKLPESEMGKQIREAFDDDKDLLLTVLLWGTAEEPKEEAVISFKIE
jgi:translation initiation factor 5A